MSSRLTEVGRGAVRHSMIRIANNLFSIAGLFAALSNVHSTEIFLRKIWRQNSLLKVTKYCILYTAFKIILWRLCTWILAWLIPHQIGPPPWLVFHAITWSSLVSPVGTGSSPPPSSDQAERASHLRAPPAPCALERADCLPPSWTCSGKLSRSPTPSGVCQTVG